MLAAAGITVNRGSLSLWANRAIALLKPIHDAQWRSVLQSAVIQMDETPIRAGRHPGKPGSMKKGYFWPVLGDRGVVVFPFAGSRQHRHAAEFLGEYAGTLVSDGYGAYQAYVAAREGTVRHQGRRFRGRDPSFGKTRVDRTIRPSLTILHRALQYEGFAPHIGYSFETAKSNVPIHAYRNHAVLFGISRRF